VDKAVGGSSPISSRADIFVFALTEPITEQGYNHRDQSLSVSIIVLASSGH
jgi:hypothetical protein